MSHAQRLYLGTRKGLFTLTRQPGGWEIDSVRFLGEPVTMFLPDPRDGWLYASLTLGHFGVKLHRSADGGAAWEECAVPEYPKGAEYGLGPFAEEGMPKTVPASLLEIWSLEAGGTDQPGLLWAGTIPGGLFRSRDRGSSWQLVETLWNRPERMEWFGGGKEHPGIHSVCVSPGDPDHITIGISCGGVWVTRDGGETWACKADGIRAEYMPPGMANSPNVQDVHRVAQCPADPRVLWVQHHNGIWHSTDGSENWQECTDVAPSGFGFAVAAHPHDPQTAWFVPAIKDEYRVPVDGRLVVTRTRDGGQTFAALSDGLPQRHCYDLVYRHGLDVDETGRVLAIGSTTGGVWISEDGGDRWDCVSTTLPPVYCVRFARGGSA